jgi:hypothetical protein
MEATAMSALGVPDLKAIEASVADYFESWFDGDVDRMRRCLHPALAKRRPPRDAETELYEIGYDDMIEDVSGGRSWMLTAASRSRCSTWRMTSPPRRWIALCSTSTCTWLALEAGGS